MCEFDSKDKNRTLQTQIPVVLTALLKLKQPLHDDTLLQKLSDLLNHQITDVDHVMKYGVLPFLRDILKNNIDTSILTFSLHLMGNLALKDSTYHVIRCALFDVYTFIQTEDKFLKEPSVATATIKGFQNVFQREEDKCILFSKYAGILQHALSSISAGSNLFLVKESIKLVKVVIKTSLSSTSNICDAHRNWIDNFTDKVFQTAKKLKGGECFGSLNNAVKFLTNALSILLEESGFVMRVFVCQEFFLDILNIYGMFTDALDSILLNHMMMLIEVLMENENVATVLYEAVCDTIMKLVKSMKIVEAQKLCIIYRMSSTQNPDCAAKNLLHDVELLPLILMNDRQSLCVRFGESVVETLDSHSKELSKCLCWTLDNACCIYSEQQCEDVADMVVSVFYSAYFGNSLSHPGERYMSVIKMRRIQLKFLDSLLAFSGKPDCLDKRNINRIVTTLLTVMQDIAIDETVYSKCLKLLYKLIMNSAPLHEPDAIESEYLSSLSSLMKRNLCNIKWEIRDCTIEFLGTVFAAWKDNPMMFTWIKGEKLALDVWQCTEDGEGYVRAAALVAASNLLHEGEHTKNLFPLLGVTQEDLVKKLTTVILKDPECPPRCSAITFLMEIFKIRSLLESERRLILQTMLQALKDFDSDVQLKVLEFWESVMSSCIPDYLKRDIAVPEYAKEIVSRKRKAESELQTSESIVKDLYETGCLKALIYASNNGEEDISKKACKLLLFIQSNVYSSCPQTSKLTKSSGVCSSHHCIESDDVFCNSAESGEFLAISFEKCLQFLSVTDFKLSLQSSDGGKNEYERNPLSLLEDILAATNTIDDEDNFVDCY